MSLNGYGVKFGIRFGSGLDRSCVFLLWMNEYVKFTLVVDVGCCGWLGKSQSSICRLVGGTAPRDSKIKPIGGLFLAIASKRIL